MKSDCREEMTVLVAENWRLAKCFSNALSAQAMPPCTLGYTIAMHSADNELAITVLAIVHGILDEVGFVGGVLVIAHARWRLRRRLGVNHSAHATHPSLGRVRVCFAIGTSYATHISPKASAPWLDQSCSGPMPKLRSASRFS